MPQAPAPNPKMKGRSRVSGQPSSGARRPRAIVFSEHTYEISLNLRSTDARYSSVGAPKNFGLQISGACDTNRPAHSPIFKPLEWKLIN
ncbi:hypothetical protein I350_00046 [Cryptococcus amylolentus CBS 6273]|uniref:Uncharacterized protein n=1 Tax=Cryptococcus amylolentus CBS 6273 TaxID=1296118 RepID=A0A1E3KDV0_9TREE|nr:hypothetical protein I350_00046 [Cryptococcus amylolentus CBS 6273]